MISTTTAVSWRPTETAMRVGSDTS